MRECQMFLRGLSWPVVFDDSKSIDIHELSRLVRYYYSQELRFERELDYREKDKLAKEYTEDFLATLTKAGGLYLGIGKLTPKEMDDAFGYPKNPNPGHTYFAGRETRSKDNPQT